MNQRNSEVGVLRPAAQDGHDQPIGMRLVELGRLDAADIPTIKLAQTNTSMRFGEMAVKLGLVSPADVDAALQSRQLDFPRLPAWVQHTELAIATMPAQPVAESIRTLRTQLALHWRGQMQTQCLSVVSAERGEGRSFIAANLAVAFAQMNERTLLIDMDLRHPRQHAIFGLNQRDGLTSLLRGRESGREIRRIDGYETLCLLPAGAVPPSPQELLAARSLSPLLERLRTLFDIIIVDTPAWSCGADTQIVSAQTGQALLVSAPGLATRGSTDRLLVALRQVGVSVAGAAVNQR